MTHTVVIQIDSSYQESYHQFLTNYVLLNLFGKKKVIIYHNIIEKKIYIFSIYI